MKTHAVLCLSLLLPALGACSPTRMFVPGQSPRYTLIAERQTASGPETWRLTGRMSGTPRVERESGQSVDVAHLGVSLKPLSREFAEARGLAIDGGVVLSLVAEGSPAEAAGLRVHDVLLSIDGEPVTSPDKALDLIRNVLRPGEPARLTRQALIHEGEDWVLRKEVLTVVPEATAVRTTSLTARDLDTADGVTDLTGMRVALLPADAAAVLLDREQDTPVITAVMPGSPAYLAGLRSGDQIVKLDGQPLVDLRRLQRAVACWALEQDVPLPSKLRQLNGLQAREEPPLLEVEGPLGRHETRLMVVDDLDDDSDFDFPIVFEWESSTTRTRWQFLKFFFQIGPAYESAYVQSETRQPESWVKTSILPLRLLDYERRGDHEEITFLWVIDWRL